MREALSKFFKDFKKINDYYNYLINKTKNACYVGITNEWIIDNFYLLAEHKTNISNDKKHITRELSHTNNIYYCLKQIAISNNYSVSFKTLVSSLKAYQKENNTNFSYREISAIKYLLLFIYTEKLGLLCNDEKNKLIIQEKIANIIDNCDKENVKLDEFINNNFDISNNHYYIYELNQQLKKLGSRSNSLFKEINELLRTKNISLKEIINDFHQQKIDNDLLVSNIFNDIKTLFELSDEELYEKVSAVEKILLEDDTYKKMTVESKDIYRRQIKKLAKIKRITELSLVNDLFKKSREENKHIGFYLFRNKNYQFRTIMYLLVITLLTFIISFFLSKYFINMRWLGFLILLVPINQLVIKVINFLLTGLIPATVLPKIDYSKGLSKDATTMVVIPTIISDTKKVKDMFDVLETFYLINKSDNLYFTLLGDAKASDKQDEEYDKEISLYGEELANSLNKKYGNHLFYFIYRKRFFNESENCYLGYERKRGALLQFNKILLGEMSESSSKKNFHVNTLKKTNLDIKYVITLDTDTRLVLSTALNLVGAMAHPLNKPVLNKDGTKVISGYGIMQPRVGVDIEATNKSLYSQIFAGVGGFDTYSAVASNVYQDFLGEGSFVGKGIYDLKVFDEVLENTFPDNLILSHDLLEGNYLRAAYVSDVELIDDFPSEFLTDTTRHHRWARGDTQIIGWLFNTVRNKNNKKVHNPINLLGKFKILDNIVRMFLMPSLLFILILSVFTNYYLWWIGFVVLEIAISIIFFLSSKVSLKNNKKMTVYYKNLLAGGRSLLYRAFITFSDIPFYSRLYLDAFFRTLYRLFVSHKNLLNWVTAEDVQKNAHSDLLTYIKNFIPNFVCSLIFIILGIFSKSYVYYIIAFIFLIAPVILYRVSLTINHGALEISEEKCERLRKLTFDTWMYFSDNLKEEYNYLIPDNYQENREIKLDMRTSPTAIGYSLTSVVCAYEMKFIDEDRALFLIKNILESVDSLEKWHGHLYNWYDIKSMEVINPRFVSTVDSGNFIASVIVVKEFLKKFDQDKLIRLCNKLISNANFKKLYTKRCVFSIGYDDNEGRLSIYNYNKFASEARLTSYIAICKGDIPAKHWFCLDKSLTTYKGRKGLISWSGTSFEYYMPLLFMKNYPNTLLDESYYFAYFCQKEYIEKVSRKLPWGISEAAYNELDNSLNYKYMAFSTPYLKAKDDKNNRIVLAPYASIMALELFPDEVVSNLEKFRNLDMLGKYGFFESYDYDNKGVVQAYFAHHQGMILIGLVNYLKAFAIKNYFHNNVSIRTFDILLKEKVQLKTDIDMKMASYKRYNYNKEKVENDIRTFNYISYMPEVSVLSNKKYTLLMNDRGNSFSRYRTLQLNRYRKVTEQDYGIFMYIKDLKTNYVWSNTFAPVNKSSDNYEVVFASDKIKYLRVDGSISTATEIVVCPNHHAEIRKIIFKNNSDSPRMLELTTYTEVILSENMDDVSHRAFNNMFVSSEFDNKNNALIMKRKNRGDSNVNNYMVSRLIINNPLDKYSFETERSKFIGRGNTVSNPISLNSKLSNYTGDNLDPVSSIRNRIVVEANSSKEVYLLVGFGRSREQINDIIKSYNDSKEINKVFRVAALANAFNMKSMNITGDDLRLFNIMLNYLYQTTKISVSEERMDLLRKNSLSQTGLWKFGISGDRPIILVDISDISDLPFVFSILKAFEYYKNNSIFVDIVIVNNENEQYSEVINREIDDEIYRMYSVNSFYHTPGIIKVIDGKCLSREEINLLGVVPRLRFIIKNHITLSEAVLELQKNNKISDYEIEHNEVNLTLPKPSNLKFDNGYGGFRNNGEEYVIYNKNTPVPWSNVIANENFGTIVTNNGAGFTYFDSSSEFKITSWTNDIVVNDKSEGFKFNGLIFNPEVCVHGIGYSTFGSETIDLKKEITEFVPVNDPVKLYLVKLTNKDDSELEVDVNYWINPTLGNFEEKTARHILSEFMGNNNYLKLRNAYSINYCDVCVYMSSSEKIDYALCDKILIKDIGFKLKLEALQEKTFVFLLSACRNEELGEALVRKYSNIDNVNKEFRNVKRYWSEKLGVLKVKTCDQSLNYMVNNWYLYQTLSSRIMAKAGFYQVSGAFGYRDQLQDAVNIVLVDPDYTRKQILINAEHQFIEGDVLHWWHDRNRFGLRSRYKDDFLWLVYATVIYVNTTGDKSILDEKVPYVSGSILSDYEYEKTMIFDYSSFKETLLEHCLKSLKLSMSALGSHGLPLMGGGDWNDGMNRVGIKGKGESVWLGFFLYSIIDMFVKLVKDNNIYLDISQYVSFNKSLKENLNKKAWDGNYYLRAYFDNGDKLGSHENSECQIDLISQSFSILSSVIPKNRIDKVINNVEEKLVDKDKKIIKLLTPAFSKSLDNPGYIMNYPKGIRENGGQYTHAVSWYIMALIKIGRYDDAYNYFEMINPINRSLNDNDVLKYKVEPYVIAADIYSSSSFPSRGGWTWYTGSSGWFYRLAINDILGIKKHSNTLNIVPNIPDDWDGFKAVYKYMNTVYNIEVKRTGIEKITFDGKGVESVRLVDDNSTHNIVVYVK